MTNQVLLSLTCTDTLHSVPCPDGGHVPDVGWGPANARYT
jgi:hypothetical protein